MAFDARSPQSSSPYARLYNAEQVRELDRCAIKDLGIPGIILMKRAGQAILDELLERMLDLKEESGHITIFCGSGNNGGDGYIVAGLAKQRNIDVYLIETAGERLVGDAYLAREFALAQGVESANALEWLNIPNFSESTVIVDALLGTGFNGSLGQPYADLIHLINQSDLPVIAADVPSGLSADTGAVIEQAVHADVTVTFIGTKIGLFTGQGRAHCGDIIFDDLEIAPEAYRNVQALATMLDYETLYESFPQRTLTNHKGDHGHVLIVGGDLGFGGAPLMAAEAAARIGTGLVSVITRAEHRVSITSRRPEIMVCDAGDSCGVTEILARATVVVVGPGLNTNAWGQKLLQSVLIANKPMVVDADALNLLASGKFNDSLPLMGSVITPHPGEASRLLNTTTQEVNQDRIAAVERLQKQFASVACLKGSGTLISSNLKSEADNCGLFLCPYGNPGMGSGGMGDVLAGIIGGLMAQGMTPAHAAQLGVCVHSYAADILAESEGPIGLMATDLIDEARRLMNGF